MKLSDFLIELRKAVNEASNSLREKNLEYIKNYFEEKEDSEYGTCLVPKIVRMDYPIVVDDNQVQMKHIDVPLISLIPFNSSKVAKASFSIDFQLDDDEDEIIVSFPKKRFGEIQHPSHLEITIMDLYYKVLKD